MHRDVKADNILVSYDLMDLHLLDFNTARSLTEGGSLTMTGTIDYSAPEVLNGESPSERHDVWGAGLCLHWMLLGRLPRSASGFPSLSDFEEAVRTNPVKCDGIEWTETSEDCKNIIRLCLSISMQDRPAPMVLLCLPWLQEEEDPPKMPRQSTFPSWSSLETDEPDWDMWPSLDAESVQQTPVWTSFHRSEAEGKQHDSVLAAFHRLDCASRQLSPVAKPGFLEDESRAPALAAFQRLDAESRQVTPLKLALQKLQSRELPELGN